MGTILTVNNLDSIKINDILKLIFSEIIKLKMEQQPNRVAYVNKLFEFCKIVRIDDEFWKALEQHSNKIYIQSVKVLIEERKFYLIFQRNIMLIKEIRKRRNGSKGFYILGIHKR
jgi:hypothetical protein